MPRLIHFRHNSTLVLHRIPKLRPFWRIRKKILFDRKGFSFDLPLGEHSELQRRLLLFRFRLEERCENKFKLYREVCELELLLAPTERFKSKSKI